MPRPDHEMIALVSSYVPRKLRAVAIAAKSDMAMFTPTELFDLSGDIEAAILRAYRMGETDGR